MLTILMTVGQSTVISSNPNAPPKGLQSWQTDNNCITIKPLLGGASILAVQEGLANITITAFNAAGTEINDTVQVIVSNLFTQFSPTNTPPA